MEKELSQNAGRMARDCDLAIIPSRSSPALCSVLEKNDETQVFLAAATQQATSPR